VCTALCLVCTAENSLEPPHLPLCPGQPKPRSQRWPRPLSGEPSKMVMQVRACSVGLALSRAHTEGQRQVFAQLQVMVALGSCLRKGSRPAPQGSFKFHQYQVVGRHLPTAADATPTVYRMKVWAEDDVKAKSKFW
jgi:hypothetical protein